MIDNTRIRSGFDVELQLGPGWFLTALSALNEQGILLPDGPPPPFQPDAEVVIDNVTILFDGNFDMRVDILIGAVPIAVLANLSLSDDGSTLIIESNLPDSEPIEVPFGVLPGLAGPPQMVKLQGDGDHQDVFSFLANMDLRASDQSVNPLPAGRHLGRGNAALAQSFLPRLNDMALGIGKDTFPRFANDIWHSQLTDDDGNQPFPDDNDGIGHWESVFMNAQSGRIRIQLKAVIPIDSPIIDLLPDGQVTITIDLVPTLVNGTLTFALNVDTDIDTGILGDIFAAITGGIFGLIIGAILSAPLAGLAIGAIAGVVILEVGEVIVEGIVNRRIVASLEGNPPPLPILTCLDDNVVEARAIQNNDGLALGPLNAIPQSIPIFTDRPDELHQRTILVTAIYDNVQMDANGLGLAGNVTTTQRFQPLPATLIGRTRNEDEELESLQYRAADGTTVELTLQEVLDRITEGEVQAPFEIKPTPAEANFRRMEGQLSTVCLSAEAIRREETVVQEILFSSGVDLKVEEAVRLQDAGAIIVRSYQLIHPSNANPYYRAVADSSTENNFENLPPF